MIKGGTGTSPLIRMLKNKLYDGLHGQTNKSITKEQAIKILTAHLMHIGADEPHSNETRHRQLSPANAKREATKIINYMYKKLHLKKGFRNAKPSLRRVKSATRSRRRTRRTRRKHNTRRRVRRTI